MSISSDKLALWDAIHQYVRACEGNPDVLMHAQLGRSHPRRAATAAVESAVERVINHAAEGDKARIAELEYVVLTLRREWKERPPVQTPDKAGSEELAQLFHETYEQLAPEYSYKTRKASAVPWSDVPESNKKLMIATCGAVGAKMREEAAKVCESMVVAGQTRTREQEVAAKALLAAAKAIRAQTPQA